MRAPLTSTSRPTSLLFVVCLAFLLPAALHADLKRALSEPNLEKRSGIALENAAAALKSAREAYDKGQNDQVAKSIAEVQDSIDLAYNSLIQSGKNPRKSDWFKKAEINTRDLERKIGAFQDYMSYEDRSLLEKLKTNVQKIHDDLLRGVMEGNKKK